MDFNITRSTSREPQWKEPPELARSCLEVMKVKKRVRGGNSSESSSNWALVRGNKYPNPEILHLNSRSGEVAQWVKCFQHKREDLNSQNPQLALEHASVVTAFPWGNGGWRQEKPLELMWQIAWHTSQWMTEPTSNKVEDEDWVVLWHLHAVHALTHKCTDLLRVLITLPQRSLSKDTLLLFSHFFPTSHLLWMEAHTASWPRELRNSQQGCYSKDFPRSDFTGFGPKLLQNLQSKERYSVVHWTNHWVRVSFSMLQGT